MNKFVEQIKSTIEKHKMLANGDKVLVGVSGGPDSIALLHVLNLLKEEYSLSLYVVHVNHMFRGEEAARDAQFVAQLAAEWGLGYQVYTKDVGSLAKEKKISSQDAGHQVRKGIFQELKEQLNFTKLALGHHAQDRAETLLIHLIQGTGLEGLASMPPRKGWLIRPLAEVKKEEILNYCQENDLTYCLDPSNIKEVYLRNKVRLSLIPYLEEEFNPNIVDNLIRLESIVEEDNKYLEKRVNEILVSLLQEDLKEKRTLDLNAFNEEPLAIRRRIVREVYQSLRPQSQGLAFSHTQQLIELSLAQRGQKKFSLPLNVRVQKGYTTLEFIDGNYSISKQEQDFTYKWGLPQHIYIPEFDQSFKAYYTQDKPQTPREFHKVVLDGDKVPEIVEIRPRQKGDRIQPVGMSGTKKLKDFLIDRKIPKEDRASLSVVATTNKEVIWIPGLIISEKYKVSAATKKYLIFEVQKGEYV